MIRTTTALAALALTLSAQAEERRLMDAAAVEAYVSGKSYTGVKPDSGDPVGTVVYNADGSSTLALVGKAAEAGSWRIEGNAYCTRYAAFRDNSENCFHLEPRENGRAQAWYTDGRRALLLIPVK